MCDFDETIVGVDTGALILEKFARGNWRYYDELYERGEMPVEEVIRRQFSLVRATKSSMLDVIDGSAPFRPGFEQLLETCSQERIPFIVVSYGLDFCIKHLLEKVPNASGVMICAPKTRVTPKGISFSFPRLRLKDSANIKDDLVRYYKQLGYRVTYVGDGASDYPALKRAHIRFAIRDSRAAGLCEKNRINCRQITGFSPVIGALKNRSMQTRGA
jgi:HAD superfamily phosphoserine phosphatase-like hydrolase